MMQNKQGYTKAQQLNVDQTVLKDKCIAENIYTILQV